MAKVIKDFLRKPKVGPGAEMLTDNDIINGVMRSFSTTTRSQAMKMFKKAVRKHLKVKSAA